MSEIAKDFFGLLSAIVGVAILTVLVSGQNQTGTVVQDVFSGFSGALGTAMGQGSSGAAPAYGIG